MSASRSLDDYGSGEQRAERAAPAPLLHDCRRSRPSATPRPCQTGYPTTPGRPGTSTPASPPHIPDHTLLNPIAAGAYGEVWLARNALGQLRAVKIVRRDRFKEPRPYEREYAGIRNYEPVSRTHEGLMDVLQVGPEHPVDWFYYVMELADDASREPNAERGIGSSESPHSELRTPQSYTPRTLHQELQRRGRLPVQECIQLGLALCRALEHLHGLGLVHRDLKPSNVIYVGGVPKLSDPGLVAGSVDAPSFVGTTGYVAPEGPGKPVADLYSLGRLLYSASTGKGSEEFPEPPSELPDAEEREAWAELNSVLLKACANDPKGRYPSAAAMRTDLERLQNGGSVRQLRNLRRRLRLLGVVSAFLGLATALGVAGFWWQQIQYRRTLALHELVTQRQQERAAGWRKSLLESIRKSIPGPGDLLWRSQAVAALQGLDAPLELYWKAHPAQSIAFNAEGNQIVVGGPTLPTQRVALAPERILASTEPGALAVTFDVQGRALELRADPTGAANSLVVQTVDHSEPIAHLVWPDSKMPSTHGAGNSPGVGRFHFFRNGSLVAGVRNGQLVVWNLPSGDIHWTHSAETPLYASDLEGRTMALLLGSGEILICDTEGGGEFRLPAANRTSVKSLAFGRDTVLRQGKSQAGGLLAVGNSAGVVTVWDLTKRMIRTHLRGSHYDVLAIAFSPDSTVLASGGRGEARLWDLATGEVALSGLTGDYHEDLVFAQDGKRLATATRKEFGPGEVTVWSIDSGRGFQSFRGLASGVHRPALSPDNRLVAAVSSDWELGVWEMATGRLLWAREIPTGISADNVGLVFSPEKHQIAFVTGRTGGICDSDTGRQLQMWNLPAGIAEALAFDAKGRLLSFRVEDAVEADHDGEQPGNTRRRAGRLRNLLAPGSPRLILEVYEFPEGLHDAVLSADGRILTVCGPEGGSAASRAGSVMTFDTTEGEMLWRVVMPFQTAATGAQLTMDTSGKVVAVNFYADGESDCDAVLDLKNGQKRRELTFAAAYALDGQRALRQGQLWINSQFGLALFEGNVPQLVLDPSLNTTGVPILSRDGSIAVWPHRDGTLHACRLDQVRAELERYGIPW